MQQPFPAALMVHPPASTTTSINSSLKSAPPADTASARSARAGKGSKGSKGTARGRGGKASRGRASTRAVSKGKGGESVTEAHESSPFLQHLAPQQPTASITHASSANMDQELEALPSGIIIPAVIPSSLLPNNSLRLELGLALSTEPTLRPLLQPSLLATLPELEDMMAGIKASGVKAAVEPVPSPPPPPPTIRTESSGAQIPASVLSRQGSSGATTAVATTAENAAPALPPAVLNKGITPPASRARDPSPASGNTTRTSNDTVPQQQQQVADASTQYREQSPPFTSPLAPAPSLAPAGPVVLPRATVTRRPPSLHSGVVSAPVAPAGVVDSTAVSSVPTLAANKQAAGQSTDRLGQPSAGFGFGDGGSGVGVGGGPGFVVPANALAGLPEVPPATTGLPCVSTGFGYVIPPGSFLPGMPMPASASQQLLLPPLAQQQLMMMPTVGMAGGVHAQASPRTLLDLGGGPSTTAAMQTTSLGGLGNNTRRSPALTNINISPALAAQAPPHPSVTGSSPVVLTEAHQALMDGLQALLNLPSAAPLGGQLLMMPPAPATSAAAGHDSDLTGGQADDDGDHHQAAAAAGSKRKAERPPPAARGGKRGRGRGGRRGAK
jgi:hypothetical protein